MSTSLLYHTQGISKYKHVKFEFKKGVLVETIEREGFSCPCCHSHDVSVYKRGTRIVTGLPIGSKGLWLKFDVHTIYCRKCKRQTPEYIPFLSTPTSRITRLLEKTIIEYHSCMSILAISKYFGVRWHTIKQVQLKYLKRQYRNVSLKGVTSIGIDEIMVGHKSDGTMHYLTIVRNIASGEVLWVGEGKGTDALAGFAKRLQRCKPDIRFITMDLGEAFSSWAQKNLPGATIIYDHFHVIKLMNDGLDKVRRSAMTAMNEEQRQCIKKQRYLFLRNAENLAPKAKEHLDKIKAISADLNTMHTFKEDLRAIYCIAENSTQAFIQLRQWIDNAKLSCLDTLKRIASTFEKKIDGIVAFWDNRLSNSHMEGFNSKLRTLIKIANGYTDEEFFKLKIFDLPDQKIVDLTCPSEEREALRQEIIYEPSTT